MNLAVHQKSYYALSLVNGNYVSGSGNNCITIYSELEGNVAKVTHVLYTSAKTSPDTRIRYYVSIKVTYMSLCSRIFY